MPFILLTFFAAFTIELLGTIISVIGLSTLFGGNPIIIAMAVSLDLGKVVVVSLAYTYWKKLGWAMKSYALLALVVTMTITSAGAAGYLSGEFQKAIVGTQEGTLKIEVLKEEQAKLEARKQQIDNQIANLPANYSRSRVTLMKEFDTEQKRISDRLVAISEELPTLQISQIGVEAKAGPIISISKAFDITVEQAVKWVILMIIFVFDPLAVFLIIAGNFLLEQWRARRVVAAPKVVDLEDLKPSSTPRPHNRAYFKQPAFTEVVDDGVDEEAFLERFEQNMDAIPKKVTQEPPTVQASVSTPEPEEIPQASPEPLPEPPAPPAPRPEIKLRDINPPVRSSLNDVVGDETVRFEDAPPAKIQDRYRDQNWG